MGKGMMRRQVEDDCLDGGSRKCFGETEPDQGVKKKRP